MTERVDMPRRPVYIRASHLQCLYLKTNSVEVTMRGKSVQLFPLRRISHITFVGTLQINKAVLVDISLTGISVHLFSDMGQRLLHLMPGKMQSNQNQQSLVRCLVSPYIRFIMEKWSVDAVILQHGAVKEQRKLYLNKSIPCKLNISKLEKSELWWDILVSNLWWSICNENHIEYKSTAANHLWTLIDYSISPWKVLYQEIFVMGFKGKRAQERYILAFATIEHFISDNMHTWINKVFAFTDDPSLCRQVDNI
jgi:hypothetical protein